MICAADLKLAAGWRVETLTYADRETWLDMRRKDITASEAGALFGEHKYQTLRQLALEKAYGENRPQNAAMRRGAIMEPSVAEAIKIDCGWTLTRSANYLRARAQNPCIRMGATRDYTATGLTGDALLSSSLIRDQALSLGWDDLTEVNLAVECKSVDPYVFEKEWGEHPPKYIIVQAAMQALLSGADGAVVACLVETRMRDLYLYAVPRRDAFEAELVARVADFWRRYDAGDEFPAEAGDNAAMATLYPEAETGQVVDLTDEPGWADLASERARLKMQSDQIDKAIDAIEVRFKDRMREASKAILPGWSITWKTNSKGARVFKCDRATGKKKR